MSLNLPSSKLQAAVASALETFRRLYLQQALSDTIKTLELSELNAELDKFASAKDLTKLASLSVRGEFVFPVPCVLRANPRLLGYYRLLLGYSQKEFFNKSKLGRFAGMEEKGRLSPRITGEIDNLCRSFCQRGSELLSEIGVERVSLDLLDHLTMPRCHGLSTADHRGRSSAWADQRDVNRGPRGAFLGATDRCISREELPLPDELGDGLDGLEGGVALGLIELRALEPPGRPELSH
jgi:hypothetical protein